MRNDGIQIRIGDILHAVHKHRILIAILTIGGLLFGLIFSGVSYMRGGINKQYLITSSMALTTKVPNGNYSSNSEFLTSGDYYLAEDMVTAAIYVLDSEKMISSVIQSMGAGDISEADISSNLTISQYEETQIIKASLYWRSAEEGIAILNTLADVSPEILQRTLNIGGISMINSPKAQYLMGGSLNATLCISFALLGFIVGVGVSIIELLMRPTLLNIKDIEDTLNLEILGEIPKDDRYFLFGDSIISRNESFHDITESFSALAHIIPNRVGRNNEHQVIYVTSANRGEGRTMAVANLAVQLSEMEKKVLIIDFDLRNPKLGSMFLGKVEYDHSLNAFYRGDINENEAITCLTGYLYLMPAVLERNLIPLDSTIFNMIKKLSDSYDYIIMDTAPIGVAVNTLSLNEVADYSLFVVRYDYSPIPEIKDTLEKMDKSGIRMLGCIVNETKTDNTVQIRNDRYSGYDKPSKEYMTGEKIDRMNEDAEHKIRIFDSDSFAGDDNSGDTTETSEVMNNLLRMYDIDESVNSSTTGNKSGNNSNIDDKNAKDNDQGLEKQNTKNQSNKGINTAEEMGKQMGKKIEQPASNNKGIVQKIFFGKAKH